MCWNKYWDHRRNEEEFIFCMVNKKISNIYKRKTGKNHENKRNLDKEKPD